MFFYHSIKIVIVDFWLNGIWSNRNKAPKKPTIRPTFEWCKKNDSAKKSISSFSVNIFMIFFIDFCFYMLVFHCVLHRFLKTIFKSFSSFILHAKNNR